MEVDPAKVIALVTDVLKPAGKNVDIGQYNYILIG